MRFAHSRLDRPLGTYCAGTDRFQEAVRRHVTTPNLTVARADGTTTDRSLDVARIANLGMSYRDPPDAESLERHAEAMEAAGVSVPEESPLVAPKPNHLITTADVIQANTADTVGELEFVLFPTAEATYVGVGNDHKYRKPGDVHVANSTCPSVVSATVWELAEVRECWDSIETRNWIGGDGDLELHQEGLLEWFLEPEAMVEAVESRISAPIEGTAIWSGTVGEDGVDPAPSLRSERFHLAEMYDPDSNGA